MAQQTKEDLKILDKMALAWVALMGRSSAKEAFLATHNIKTTSAASIDVMLSRWLRLPKCKDFIEDIKKQITQTFVHNLEGDEEEALTTEQLMRIAEKGLLAEVDPKKKADLAVKIAGWKKDEQQEQQASEQTHFYLPYVSHCRSCKLMALARQFANEIQEKENNK